MAEYGTEREAIIGVAEMDRSGGFSSPQRLVFRNAEGGHLAALVGPDLCAEYVERREAEGYVLVGVVGGNDGNRNYAVSFDRFEGVPEGGLCERTWLKWNWRSGVYEPTDLPFGNAYGYGV